jgi:hypothetical protein
MMNKNYLGLLFYFSLFIPLSGAAEETQEFTFVVEPAYTQEDGEWQLNLVLDNPSYQHGISTSIEAGFSLEYGFSDVLQAEFSAKRANEFEEALETEMSVEYELGLSYMLVKQYDFLPQLTIAAGAILEESEYGYEAALLYSYQLLERHFIHGNLIYEHIDKENEVAINLAYALKFDESWTILTELERNKEKDEGNSPEYVNTFSVGVVFETESDIELGLAYLIYNGDTIQDYSWQFKAAYEF